jgi:alpha-L-arabinofuranosidase
VTGGVTVPATGVPLGQIPALYAMSYTSADGALAVVITNKSAAPHSVIIRVNGEVAPGSLPVHFVTGTDPSAANTPANPTAVTIQSGRFTNPVTVPPYSVVRVDVITPPRRPRDVTFRN